MSPEHADSWFLDAWRRDAPPVRHLTLRREPHASRRDATGTVVQSRSQRHTIPPVALALLNKFNVLALHVRAPRVVESLRFQVFDTYQRLSPRPQASAPVVLIDIDDASLRRLGQWPWPRTRIAALMRRLHDAGAAVVGMDLILAEPDLTSPENVIPLWSETEAVARIRDAFEHLPEHDAILADAIRHVPVVTGFALTQKPNAIRPPRPYSIEIAGPSPLPVLPEFHGAVANLPRIDAGARGVGAFNFLPAVDGVLRRIPLLLRIGEEIRPSFAVEILRVLLRADGYEIRVEDAGFEGALPAVEEVAVGGLVIPTDEAGRMWLHYTRPEARRSLPAWQVLAGEVPAEALSGHVVAVGTSAAGLKDLRTTPLDLAAPGVAVHAAAVEQMLLGHFLERPSWVEPVELIYTIVLGLILILLLRRLKALGCAALGAVAVAAATGSSWHAYTEYRMLVDPVLPSLVALLIYITGSLINFARTEAERRRVRLAFGHYLAPAVVQQLLDDPETLRLGGERRETTFLFTDLAGFTSLTERLEPAELVRLLNEYLDGTCRIVLKHGGTIDKIVGDALHVMFNAPGDQPDHAQRAVECALELDEFCSRYAAEQRALGVDLGNTRIGVNTGETVVGNFGGATRFDYTAHGDAINAASRLESVNKYFDTRVCVSETTLERCANVHCRPIGQLVLKGRSESLGAFEVLSASRAEKPEITEYTKAYRLLETGDPSAAERFAELSDRYPEDGLLAFYAIRLQAEVPGVVIRLTDK